MALPSGRNQDVHMGGTAAPTTMPMGRDARFRLTAAPAAAARARALTRATFLGWACRELVPDAVLIVSELVSNAVVATPGHDVWLLLDRSRDAVWICVWDSSPDLPQMRACGPEAESGRGLHIVAALAEESGAFPVADPQGKVTWARLKASPAFPGSTDFMSPRRLS